MESTSESLRELMRQVNISSFSESEFARLAAAAVLHFSAKIELNRIDTLGCWVHQTVDVLQDSADDSAAEETDDDLSISVTGSSLSADFGLEQSSIHPSLPTPTIGLPAPGDAAHARILELEDQMFSIKHEKQMLELRLDRIHRANEAEQRVRGL